MSALADHAAAAHEVYETQVTARFTPVGASIRWRYVAEPDLSRIVPRIEEHADNLRSTYRVTHNDSDTSDITLELEFKRVGDRADLIRIKGDVFAVLVDTSWGGSG